MLWQGSTLYKVLSETGHSGRLSDPKTGHIYSIKHPGQRGELSLGGPGQLGGGGESVCDRCRASVLKGEKTGGVTVSQCEWP